MLIESLENVGLALKYHSFYEISPFSHEIGWKYCSKAQSKNGMPSNWRSFANLKQISFCMWKRINTQPVHLVAFRFIYRSVFVLVQRNQRAKKKKQAQHKPIGWEQCHCSHFDSFAPFLVFSSSRFTYAIPFAFRIVLPVSIFPFSYICFSFSTGTWSHRIVVRTKRDSF